MTLQKRENEKCEWASQADAIVHDAERYWEMS
jgi:hypothetical protein